jgi:lysophospholipase L1-like esterase
MKSRQVHHTALIAAAAGVTGVMGAAGLAWVGLSAQAAGATRHIEEAAVHAAIDAGLIPPDGAEAQRVPPPLGDGVLLASGPTDDPTVEPDLTVAMIGDSTAVGYGTSLPADLPGVLLARGLAALTGDPVRLLTVGVVGAESVHLDDQVTAALQQRPDIAVIVIGANDITAKVAPTRAAAQLGAAVRRLRAAQVEVVVATCPDFGVIAPIPQPLRAVLTRWSRGLAAAQARAVRAAGGTPVAMAQLVSPFFRGKPDLFFADGFHPSAAGYRTAVGALLPAVATAATRIRLDRVAAQPGLSG